MQPLDIQAREKPQHFPRPFEGTCSLIFILKCPMKSRDPKASNRPPHKKRCFGEDLSFIQKYWVVATQPYSGSDPEGSGRVRVPLCSLLHKHNEAQPSGVLSTACSGGYLFSDPWRCTCIQTFTKRGVLTVQQRHGTGHTFP